MMEKFIVTYENIDKSVQTVSEFLKKHKVEQKDVLRSTLALEDTLLNYRNEFGENTVCSLNCVHRFGRLRIELTVDGKRHDIFVSDDEENFSRTLMAGMGMAPVWQYKNGQNVIIFSPKKKKPSQMVYILIAIACAFACGLLSKLLSPNVQSFISNQILLPVSDTILGLLNAVAAFMIFLSVVWGICNLGDMATLTQIGKKMISRMLIMMTIIPTLFAVCTIPFYDFSAGAATGEVDVSGPFEMLLGIIPSNLITPFTEGSFLQIVFIAVIVGIALLVLGNKTPVINSFIEQANAVIQLILEVICSFVPVIVFISIYNIVVSGDYSVIYEAYKAPLMIILGCFSAALIYVCLVCITGKVKPSVLLSKIMPSFLIGLTTASSSAALSTTMETCTKQYGIDKKIVNFGIPLGRIIFGISSVIEFIVLSFCMAEIYNLSVTPIWIVITIFTSIILKIATPPIPGGSVALCTILFNQLGLPMEGLAVAVAVDVIADFFITATDILCLQSELVVLSGKLNLIEIDKLRSKKIK